MDEIFNRKNLILINTFRIMTKEKTKKEQQGRGLEYQHFDLLKFKMTKDGVDVTHHETVIEPRSVTVSSEYQPHPDLKEKMDQLKLYMATRLGLLAGWDFSRDILKGGDLDKYEEALSGHKDVIERCNVNGLTFLGEGETFGVSITGSIKVPKGGSVGLAVPKITFGSDKLGYEKEVEEICEEIKKEVYSYRFQSKKLQLDIDTELKKKENPELFNEPGDDKKNKEENLI